MAKRDMKSLENFVCGMRFNDAYKALNGFNLESWDDGDGIKGTSFDVNYKSITTTIFKDDDGYCFLYDTCDVWVDSISSPIKTITFMKK